MRLPRGEAMEYEYEDHSIAYFAERGVSRNSGSSGPFVSCWAYPRFGRGRVPSCRVPSSKTKASCRTCVPQRLETRVTRKLDERVRLLPRSSDFAFLVKDILFDPQTFFLDFLLEPHRLSVRDAIVRSNH